MTCNFKTFEYFDFMEEEPVFIKDKGVFGFADEFVKCNDERHLKLMKYILDEYIIVDNFSTAKKLSEDNYYKFITLEGDIVTNGFIRSGGKVNERLSQTWQTESNKRYRKLSDRKQKQLNGLKSGRKTYN
ncbi:MAG: hypothetical protein IPM38_09300 [Ignavibacteria bacterium]|nr:hypothetical protein [Ignavibacteria bacterium]